MHVFISPHLDDAVLSCGGLIHQLVARGENVEILTIFAGDPPHPLPDTLLIRDLHQRWAVGENPYRARRQEDHAAAAVLGVAVRHLGLPDCPYRTATDGTALYTVNTALFGAVHPADPALHLQIDLAPTTQLVYAPLGAGGHVDHQIVTQLLRDRADFFYEEYPYSSDGGEAGRWYRVPQTGSNAVQNALAAFDDRLAPVLISLQEDDLTAKTTAIACYQSQLNTFWADIADMQQRVRHYAAAVNPTAPAERLWAWKK